MWRDVVTKARSSRRGKEEIKLKIFESGIVERIRESDLRVEKHPYNWTREISWLSCRTEKDQMVDAVKGVNPASDIWIYEYGRTRFEKGHGACVVSKRVGRIWKAPFPQLDGAFWGMESDASEKVLSGPRNPSFGDDAAGFKRSRFIAKVVDDDIE